MAEEPPIRRIVTGYDASGKSIITRDGAAPNRNVRPHGTISTVIWSTDETPCEFRTDEDFGARENVIQPPPRGSWFRIVEFPAGGPGRMHRTDTVDYVICMTGEIDMEMDDGLTIHMTAGDVMIQQGTNHSWINRGEATCRIAFVLMAGKLAPVGNMAGPGARTRTPQWDLPADAPPQILPSIRRIVTTHDGDGKAIIMMDGPAPRRELRGRGNLSTLIWGSDETPAEIWTNEDFGIRDNEIPPPPMGSWFRIIDYPASMTGRMHRTDTVDYIVCMAGEIDMELDDGLTVHMNEGDVMIQQGTNHSWVNNSNAPCRIAFILIDGKPAG